MAELKPNPKRLAVWVIAGASLVTSICFLAFLPIPRLSASGRGFWSIVWMNRLRFVVFFVPLICGVAISQWAERRFKRAAVDGVWSEAELAPVRSLLASRSIRWVALVFGVVWVVLFSVRRHGWQGGFLVYVLMFPSQTALRLRQSITPRVVNDGRMLDSENIQPIRSEHWGESKRDEGELLHS